MFRRLFLVGFSSLLAMAGTRDAQWTKVEAAMGKGLPGTAIAELEPIVKGAMADRAYGEAVKAIGLRIKLEGTVQGNKPEEKLLRLQEELAKAPSEMKPMMACILAHWYWEYFQMNRWRFIQRTRVEGDSGGDPRTWDLGRILEEIDRQFTAALASSNALKTLPIATFQDVIKKGTLPVGYRPTLFDFVAHEALTFYAAAEQAGATREDAFEVDAGSPIFSGPEAFLAWRPATGDASSPTFKAIRLFQELMAFHAKDRDRSAFADVDLTRLEFGYNHAAGEEKEARYKAALTAFAEETKGHEISARARALLGTLLQGENALVEARSVARLGMETFPDSPGGVACFNLVRQIDQKSVSIGTERVWNEPMPTLDVSYRNVTRLHFRIVEADFDAWMRSRRWGGLNEYGGVDPKWIDRAPALAWQVDLAPTTDFRQRTTHLQAPKGLRPGFYMLLASPSPDFGPHDNVVSATSIWVSDLTMVVRSRRLEGGSEAMVLNAITGAPVGGAKVVVWKRKENGFWTPGETITTDPDGLVRLPKPKTPYESCILVATGQDGTAVLEANLTEGRKEPKRDSPQTILFTDRSIYRPGQTISFKGICIQMDPEHADYHTLPRRAVSVVFRDSNQKVIEHRSFDCNDQGSFSGVFTAPRDRVLGRMSLQADPSGDTTVQVEEYKRPRFHVDLPAPKEGASLGTDVVVVGNATAYTGAAVDGARIAWRVQREVNLPAWCWWWRGVTPGSSQSIAHGTGITEPDGSFRITFLARPDLTVPEKDEPVFRFTVHVDVTDASGETRSEERTVNLGYTAFAASLSTPAWLTEDRPVEVQLRTSTHDGEAQSASGVLTISSLRQPSRVLRASLNPGRVDWDPTPQSVPAGETDPSLPATWESGDVLFTQPVQTDPSGTLQVPVNLKAGIYRASLEARDRFGKPVTARVDFQVVTPKARHYGLKLADHFAAPSWSVKPGETFTALWGTGYEEGRAFVELECKGKVLKRYWTSPGRTQELISQVVDEGMRGGFTIRTTFVRENRAYFHERIVDVPWSNKELSLRWEHFTSKLTPGQKETWTLSVSGPDAWNATAEMVATLYDASLDQFLPHDWMHAFSGFRKEWPQVDSRFGNGPAGLWHARGAWDSGFRSLAWTYPTLDASVSQNLWGYQFPDARQLGKTKGAAMAPPPAIRGGVGANAVVEVVACVAQADKTETKSSISLILDDAEAAKAPPAPAADLSKVVARRNMAETAFFYPHLLAGTNGTMKLEFTMPETLTEWKFLGFAHDRDLRSGYLTGRSVTSKDLMVQPNPPRFLREGDTVEFTVKVSNPSAEVQSGTVRVDFTDARTGESRNQRLGNTDGVEKAFDIPARESRTYSWRITVPDGCDFLAYKAVGASARVSDGEEGFLPVLGRRILVTESLPLPMRNRGEKAFEFKQLLESGRSATLRQESLTVQMVSQPAWYAVMALPYLMEFPYECSEQVFNRLYANAVARHIATSLPKIRQVFDQWRGTAALDSPLEKNRDLQSVLLEETPWLRQATSEKTARHNVGLLFEANRLDSETTSGLRKLGDMQLEDGRWPWFPGGRGSDFITLYVATGFGRLRHLGIDLDVSSALRAMEALDGWMDDNYHRIRHREAYVPGSLDALYLYGRSFFLKERPIQPSHREAIDFYLVQARKNWLKLANRQSQAHLALALARFRTVSGKEDATPEAILRSIKERSVVSDELGMTWMDQEPSWWWYRAPIETQAVMIEAFDEVAHDPRAVEDCQVWLLKQKQTQDWKTTKATADAIYALLLRGAGRLGSDALVDVSLGGNPVQPKDVEAGTGFFEQRFLKEEVKPSMGHIHLRKADDGVSWGSAHWQYLEDVAKVAPFEGTPLRIRKALFVKETTAKGQALKPVTGPVSVGDELVVRIELRTDRDMEYVHLKDQRGSGTEPVEVLSRYRYQDGLAYYESTLDTATHFFIDYLPKGTYVFEYPVRVQLRGRYQTGIASIQCMYAPEFNSHSESVLLEAR
jgi:hypothetical protein